MRLTIVAAFLAISSDSNAQGWSITAHAPSAGTATASIFIAVHSATLPVGPVMPGTFLARSMSFPPASASIGMMWSPVVGSGLTPLAFTASSNCSTVGDYSSSFASGTAVIDLTLRAPQPVGGRLSVGVSGSDAVSPYSTSNSRIDLDVNADGTIEVSAQTGAASPPLDLPLQIPATGAVIRLTYNSSSLSSTSSTGFYSASSTRSIVASFYPGEPAVAPFATFSGAATMSVDHGSPGTVTLSIVGPGLTPVLMAFGGTAISVPWLPHVTVLVSPDVLIGTTGSITLQLPPLPPGALYAQGLAVDSAGTLRGTNSVRFLWL